MMQGLTLTWEGVGAVSAVLAGAVGLTGYYFRIMVRAAVSEAMQTLLDTADGRYVGQKVCEERHDRWRGEVENRIRSLEKPRH